MYRELILIGTLTEHCAEIDKIAFNMAEQIRADYLKTHPLPDEDTMERVCLCELAQDIAEEMVITT